MKNNTLIRMKAKAETIANSAKTMLSMSIKNMGEIEVALDLVSDARDELDQYELHLEEVKKLVNAPDPALGGSIIEYEKGLKSEPKKKASKSSTKELGK